ncbi:MAG TPA: hypothetical protein VMY38_06255 [Gemmatimonadaceae bacterium]|nr:hypothetical protein [Gemmatimonadaceae bacterium]
MKRRFSPAVLVSLAAHAVVGVIIVQSLLVPRLFTSEKVAVAPAERIGFLSIPRGEGPEVVGRRGGDGSPASAAPAPALVAPTAVPDRLPAVPAATVTAPVTGTGPLVGGGGPTRGVRPSFTGPRVWAPPGPIMTAPRTTAQVIDDAIRRDVAQITDSVVALGPRRDPTDWTVERNGRKWGIDQKAIRLGPVSIPTALLALLPINAQANPVTMARERQLNYMHRDIAFHAQRAINENQFRDAVRNLRVRKERERAEQKEREPVAPAQDGSGTNR